MNRTVVVNRTVLSCPERRGKLAKGVATPLLSAVLVRLKVYEQREHGENGALS
jgi:hypothetical protein